MKKRIMMLFVAIVMVVVAVACGKGYKVGSKGEVYDDYIKIKKWKELEVEKVEPTPVTDATVSESIKSDLQALAKTVDITGRAAAMGDQVVIDFVGKSEGVAFDGGSANDQIITLGEAGFIDGFEKGIVGHKPGDIFDLPLTFPKDYQRNPDLAGKAVVFTITLDKIQEIVIPELNDGTLAQLSKTANTIDEYKAQVKANLEKNNKRSAEAKMKADLLAAFLGQCEVISYPKERLEDSIKKYTEFYTKQLEEMAATYGTTLEGMKEFYDMTEEELIGESFEDIAKEQLLCELAIELIQKVEKFDFSNDAYEKFLEEQSVQYGFEDSDATEEAYEKIYGEGSCKLFFKQEKMKQFLYENCVIIEPEKSKTGE